jgi:hypothetical protein
MIIPMAPLGMPFLPSLLRRYAGTVLVLALAGIAGCKDRSMVVYRVPREILPADSAPSPAAPIAMGAGASGAPSSIPQPAGETPSLRWKAPADWQARAVSAMRKGSYTVGEAEVAITVFAGDVGGVLANVNRWRGQAGLAPVDEAGLDAVTTQLISNGFHFIATDAAGSGPAATRIVAVLVPWQGSTWFFKLTGPNEAVERAKPAFLDFIQTVEAP